MPSSGECLSQRSWGAANLSSSCYRLLAGAERGFAPCPPSNDVSPEVRISLSHQLRRNTPNRSWCLPPVSALLDGVGLFGIRPPPASECWPELSADSQAVLRLVRSPRKTAFSPRTISGEANPNRSWCFPPLSAFLNGVGLFGIRPPPASECWPELSA